ncbi:MAG: hypothetical protein ACRD3F_16835 [Acidobacteriaceae bacterium]
MRAGEDQSKAYKHLSNGISNAGLRESHVHDVIITREAPNYHVE